MRFRTTIELGGKTATGMEAPAEVVEALGAGKRAKARVTIGGHTYRTTVAPYSGVYMLPLAAEQRTAAGVAAGNEVEVDIEVDTEERVVQVPPDLAAALAIDDAARRVFEALSYSNRRRHVLLIEEAKTAETRARRIAKVVQGLGGSSRA